MVYCLAEKIFGLWKYGFTTQQVNFMVEHNTGNHEIQILPHGKPHVVVLTLMAPAKQPQKATKRNSEEPAISAKQVCARGTTGT